MTWLEEQRIKPRAAAPRTGAEPRAAPAPAPGAGAEPRRLRAAAARNRQRLIDAAEEVFAARGLDATLDDIARHSGLNYPPLRPATRPR